MSLLADGAALQSGASAVGGTADALETATGRLDAHVSEASGAAGHDHVVEGLADFTVFHQAVLRGLAVAADTVAAQIRNFDQCMGETDRALAEGC